MAYHAWSSMAAPALSFVIPLYHSAETIASVVQEIQGLEIDGGHEIVLVHDGSGEATSRACEALLAAAPRDGQGRVIVPIALVEHARNFGEHNAVLTGWRNARGRHIVNLDDDGQNPPAEARAAVAARARAPARRRLRPLRGEAALRVAQPRELVHQPHDRLGARQAARVLSLQLPLRQCLRRGTGRRLRGTPSVHRRPAAAGDAANRVHHGQARAAARRGQHLHAGPPDTALDECVGQLLAAAAASRDRARPVRRGRGRGGVWRGRRGCG